MNKNLGQADRALRIVGSLLFAIGAVLAPFELAIRLCVFGASSAYMMITALSGTCLGYRLLGVSTCPRKVS